MKSTKQAAEELGITQTRVRELLNSGALHGEKVGRSWMVYDSSIRQRNRDKPQPGRPKKGQALSPRNVNPALEREVELTRSLYELCKEHLSGCFDMDFLDLAQSEDERSFYTTVANFFLQSKQRELVERGVY